MKTTSSYFQGMFENPAPAKYYFKKQNQDSYEIKLYTNASITIVVNIWMICLDFKWFFYDSSWMLQLSEFVWTLLRSSARVVFNNFLLIDTTDRRKISSD